jgi:hypothetical protein
MVERMVFHGHWRTMTDGQVVRLDQEIRDIQKENAANYKVAWQNQQEAVAIQKRGGQRSQAAFVGLVVLCISRTYLVSLLSWFFNWTLRH